ncbi:conjugal transfer protein TraD [Asticcacaulis sp. ZE23SCel15]|uniref:conjugal transfer protein TraD n=1 Tax=Asticcacaulis sp. ZE23SCel15 TaxID=3059027 RepID=UPI00265EA960|nr:conjugal transfer protein TraD [Asticcacaulis sp. ZE23SCel15]WKL57387.1 conjugal transfer protein TraD [Asticcacaulis sp. ZE23SCel15]
MRKPRDFDAELKALNDRARTLKERKIRQLGELIIATGADALDIDTLAGGLLGIVSDAGFGRKEAMAKAGAAFFRRGGKKAPGIGTETNPATATKADGFAEPFELKPSQD